MFDLNIDEEITILEKYNITPTELFVIKAINAYIEDYSEDYLRTVSYTHLTLPTIRLV